MFLKNQYVQQSRSVWLSIASALCVTVLVLWPEVSAASSSGALSAVNDWFLNILHTIVVSVFGLFVWIGGLLLDYGIKEFVVNFGSMYVSSGLGFTVDRAWGLIRDIFNLTFIFGLVFIGFQMIFGNSGARRGLIYLILAALLVNFSLFFTKFVIDFTNIAATQIVTAAFPSALVPTSPGSPGTGSVSILFANVMGVSSIFFASGAISPAAMPTGMGSAGYGYIFGMLIMFCVAAFVFAAGGILLIVRFVALNIYMIFSPFMFLGWVFPAFSGFSKRHVEAFLKKAFVAPAYVLMLYLSYQLLITFGGSTGTAGRAPLAGLFSGGSGVSPATFGSTFVTFILVSAFLIASIVVAEKIGAEGASTALKVGKNLRGRAQRMVGSGTFGSVARGSQLAVGGGARAVLNNDKFKDWASKSGRMGRIAYQSTQKVADSSFDARNTGLGSSLGVGKGYKGGFDSRVKEKAKLNKKFLDDLGTIETSLDDAKDYLKNQPLGQERQRVTQAKRDASAKSVVEQEKAKKELNENHLVEKTRLEAERDKAPDDTIKALVEERLKTLEADHNAKESKIDEELERLRKELAVDEKVLKNLPQTVQNELTYRRQLEYIQNLKATAERQAQGANKFGAGAGLSGGLIGAAAVGGGLLPALAAGGYAGIAMRKGYAYQNEQIVKELTKEYGDSGEKKKKQKEQKEAVKKRLEAEKDILGTEEEKKDDEKSDDKDDKK